MSYELAKAYVQIVPSAEGLGSSLIDELGGAGDAAGAAGGKRAGSAFGKALGTAGKVAGAALAAAAAGVGALAKQAVSSYADFEQLAGGAELLFGDAYDFVAEKATGAWATVQMSQNDYLEQVNGFAVGLKTALGGDEQAAAELADKIITAEADIVAATGNSQEAVQNAFNGVMKGNYTMLDNLQLGITPTKEGFQEVIDKVNEWNASMGNATNYQMGNLAGMESALVDYVAMQGLAGYAANEATETISGSLSALSASWANLLTDMANPDADIAASVSAVVQSAETALTNLLPVAESALAGIGQLVENLAPIIAGKLPGLVEAVLPSLLGAATSLLNGVVAALPTLLQVLMDQVPTILMAIVNTLLENLPMIVSTAAEIINSLITGIGEALPTLIPAVIDCILTIVETLTTEESISQMISAADSLLIGLANGLIRAIPRIIEAIPQIIINLVTGLIANLPQLVATGIELLIALGHGLLEAIPQLVLQIPQIVISLVTAFAQAGRRFLQVGRDMIAGLWNGIKEKFEWVKSSVLNMFTGMISAVKNFLGIRSPSRVFADIGARLPQGLAGGIEDNARLAIGAAQDMADGIAAVNFGIGFEDTVADMTVRTRAAEAAAYSVTTGAAAAQGGDLVSVIEALNRKIDRMAVYIDKNKLVGYIAPDMDEALGSRAVMAGRGALA